MVIRGRHAARGSGRRRAGECRARRGCADVCTGSAVRAAVRGRRDGVGRRAQRAVHRGARQRGRPRGGRVLPGPKGSAGLRLRRVHVPCRHELRARRRLGAGGRGHRRCRSNGNRGRAPALGTHAALALRPGSPVPRRPPGAGAARRRTLPVGGARPFGGAVGAHRPARPHRMGGRRDELAQRRLALLPGRLRAGARAGAARAVRAPQRGQRPVALPLRRVRPDDRPRGRGARALVGARRGGRRGPADRARAQAVRPGRPLRRRRAVPGRHGRAGRGGAGDRAGVAVAPRGAARRRRAADPVPGCGGARSGARVTGAVPGGPRPRPLAVPAGPPRHPGSGAAASPGPGGRDLRAGRPAGAFPRRVLPPAESPRAGGVVGHVVHPAGRRPARAGAPCRLRRRARAHRVVGVGLRGGRNAGPLPARVLGRRRGRPRPRARAGARWTRSTCPRSRPGCCGRTDPVLPCCRRSGSTGSTPCG